MNSFLLGFFTVGIKWSLLTFTHPRIALALSSIVMAIFYTWLGQWFPTTADVMFTIGMVLNIATYIVLNP